MISTRHIRHDWQRWFDQQQKSVKALCGATTTSKYSGVPGVTPQQIVVPKGDNIVWGWCQRCCANLLEEIKSLPTPLPVPEKVAYHYRIAYNVALTVCGERDFSKRLYVPWDNRESKFDSRLNKHEFASLERNQTCYLCGNHNDYRGVIDHITPRILGGMNDEDNLAVVHPECNSVKSGLTLNQVRPCFPNLRVPEWW